MSMTNRLIICAGILLVDILVFFVPLTAFFLIYILVANPLWFRQFLEKNAGGGDVHKIIS